MAFDESGVITKRAWRYLYSPSRMNDLRGLELEPDYYFAIERMAEAIRKNVDKMVLSWTICNAATTRR